MGARTSIGRCGRSPGRRQDAEPVQQALHLGDLAAHDATEIGHEALVALPARQELRERLDRLERVLDLVRDARREHLEVREPLGPLPLHLERLERRQIAEDRDGPQHDAGLIVQRRRRADDRPGRGAVGQLGLGLRSGAAAGDGLGEHCAHACWQHAQRLIPNALDGSPRELRRGPVEEGDLPARVDRHDPALERGDDVVEVLVGEEHLRVELRVLHRDTGLIGERHQEIEILGIERIARELRPDHDSPDDVRFGDERQDERPVEARERLVQPLAIDGRPFVGDLVRQQKVLGLCQSRDDLFRRRLGRIEVTLRMTLLRDRPPEPWPGLGGPGLEVDRGTLRVRRRRHRVVHELEQHLEIENPRQRLARFPQRALVVHARAIDVAIEEPPRGVARERDEDANDDDGDDESA